MDPQEVCEILQAGRIGRLATLDDQGYPYITPVNYIFQDGLIYFHSSPQGEKMKNLEQNARVCFEVDRPLAYLGVDFNPDRNPCRAHQLYQSVIIRGKARILPEGQKKVAILNDLVAQNEGHRFFNPITEVSPGYSACRVVEIHPVRMTGKAELGQSHPQREYRALIMQRLAERRWPGDLETLEALNKVIS
jgi:uncharacterized protein